jgi:hypothetical protein
MDYALYLAQLAFTVWMLVDCYRRGADTFWFFVIFLFQPVGPWVYFFAVKGADWSGSRGWSLSSLFQRRPSLEELRYRAEQTPTLASRLALAERLMERGEHAEAIPYLKAALALEPEHCHVLYLLAVCHAEHGHPEESLPLLEKVLVRDRAWSSYTAWRRMVSVKAQGGDSPGALKTARDLVRLAPTLEHRCLLAERLLAEGQTGEARDVLEQSLEDHRYAPGLIRRRNRRWASHAKRLHKRVCSNGQ